MGATTICFSIQKGGVGKTTSSALTSFLLANDYGKKVLAVDFDSQGNLTQFLTQRNNYDFTYYTSLEAIMDKDARQYIYKVNDNLDVLPAEDRLIMFTRWIFTEYKGGDPILVLKETLNSVREDYDYIIIDTPPNVGEQTLNALAASDYVVIMLQSEFFALDAIHRFLRVVDLVREGPEDNEEGPNPELKIAGILPTLLDVRRTTDHAVIENAKEEFSDIMFNTVIKRRGRITVFTYKGIQDKTKQDKEALQLYRGFLEELMDKIEEKSAQEG